MGGLFSFTKASPSTSIANGNLYSHSKKGTPRESPPPGTKWHQFVWRHGGKSVCITGSFDNWSGSQVQMHSTDGSHKACIPLDPSLPWQFKFVVDGVWRCSLDYPTVKDMDGNTNNILYPE